MQIKETPQQIKNISDANKKSHNGSGLPGTVFADAPVFCERRRRRRRNREWRNKNRNTNWKTNKKVSENVSV